MFSKNKNFSLFVKKIVFKCNKLPWSVTILLDSEGTLWFLFRSVLFNLGFVENKLRFYPIFVLEAKDFIRVVAVEEIKHLYEEEHVFGLYEVSRGYLFIDEEHVNIYISRTPDEKKKEAFSATINKAKKELKLDV